MRLKRLVKRPVRRIVRGLGYEISRIRPVPQLPQDFRSAHVALWGEVAPYTMTTPDAVYVLADAVRYVVSNSIPGAIVECGVWRGGSMLAVARTLLDLGRTDIDLYLFDTFVGMTEPTEKDVLWTGETASEMLAREPQGEDSSVWAQAPLAAVKQAMGTVPYPESRIHFVEGKVEETIPSYAPDEIAVLRLDTDWYESTKHELIHLYPRLAQGGVLVIDDYGWWRGAGEATDDYFAEHGPRPFLVRIDDEGRRFAVKVRA